ncbi:hypothetical protein CLOM_g19159 [Closterium sp. NIES-68]|nr:hypothetical protein CLOM_g19159 [Closterium sp. NIES-68]
MIDMDSHQQTFSRCRTESSCDNCSRPSADGNESPEVCLGNDFTEMFHNLSSDTPGVFRVRRVGGQARDGSMAPLGGWVLPFESEPLSWHFVLGDEILRGASGIVRRCTERRGFGKHPSACRNSPTMACKTIPRRLLRSGEDVEIAQAEVAGLMHVSGDEGCRGVQLRGVFEDRKGYTS